MKNQNRPEPIYLKDYQAPHYLVESVDLYVEIDEEETKVRSELKIKQNSEVKTKHPLVLYGENQTLISLTLEGKLLSQSEHILESDKLIIPEVPDQFTLEIVSTNKPRLNTALSGLYLSGNMFCTQCEAEGFRRITYYLDRPDVMAKFKTTLVADKKKYPVLLSNGNAVERGDIDQTKHFVTWLDPFPKPSYLFAMVAGDLMCVKDTFKTMSGRAVALEIYVEPGNEDKCDFAMESLKKAMAWDEKTYGREYDLDIYMIVAANDFNMGAMENKGLNIFNAKYVLANEATATDHDFHGVELVIGHEYFHNWTGNRITCRDWFQLSLKEGLTVFREQQFSAFCGGGDVKRIENVQILRNRQFPEDKGPMAHPVRPQSYIEINNFYTMTVYYKGSEVIRMMHTLLGQDNFRKGMDLYFERFDGQAVTTDDFVQAISDANQIDLSQFKRWYCQAGTPLVNAKGHYDQEAKTFTLTLSQHTEATADGSPKDPFFMPVKVSLLTEEGQTIEPKCDQAFSKDEYHAILILKEPSQSYLFQNVEKEPIPSLFEDFSAPVICHYGHTSKQLATLIAHDKDPFNRWDAAQTLLSDVILDHLSNHVARLDETAQALAHALQQAGHAPALTAALLKMPSLEYLGKDLGTVPILPLIQSREKVQKTLSDMLYDDLMNVYHLACRHDNHQMNPKEIEYRALKNASLYLLGQSQSQEVLNLCGQQFKEAYNMTDAYGALCAMNDYDMPIRNKCFDVFYQIWEQDPLVVNKWLGLQAVQKVENALEKIIHLCLHKAFDIHNPNKVYALIGGFSNHNPRFHQVDGEGYDFLAEKIIVLNRINPQVASRMLEPLSFWKRYANPNQDMMKRALLKIQNVGDLSPDVYEIVTKALKGS